MKNLSLAILACLVLSGCSTRDVLMTTATVVVVSYAMSHDGGSVESASPGCEVVRDANGELLCVFPAQ